MLSSYGTVKDDAQCTDSATQICRSILKETRYSHFILVNVFFANASYLYPRCGRLRVVNVGVGDEGVGLRGLAIVVHPGAPNVSLKCQPPVAGRGRGLCHALAHALLADDGRREGGRQHAQDGAHAGQEVLRRQQVREAAAHSWKRGKGLMLVFPGSV